MRHVSGRGRRTRTDRSNALKRQRVEAVQRAEVVAHIVGRLARNQEILPSEIAASGVPPERIAVAVEPCAMRHVAGPPSRPVSMGGRVAIPPRQIGRAAVRLTLRAMRGVATTGSATRSCSSATTCPSRRSGPTSSWCARTPPASTRSTSASAQGHLAGAFPHHFPIVPGWDLAGVVEQVGPAVVDFAPGDEVFGYVRRDDVQWGTAAELVPVPQRCLAHKPESLSFAEAGALPLAGLTAYQALTEVLDVGEGDRVLVHRASGGVGFFAVQIAVALGAHVDRDGEPAEPRLPARRRGRRGARLLRRPDQRSAGPSRSTPSWTSSAATPSPTRRSRCATPPASPASSTRSCCDLGGRYVFVRPDPHDLEELARMADAGQLRVPIAKAFPLEQIADAHRLVAGGHVRGKVVVTLR